MRDLFAIAKFLLTIGRLLLHCWYSLGRPVTIGTPMVIFTVLTVFWLFLVHCWYTVGTATTVLVDMWRLIHQWPFLCCFDCVLTVFDDWYTVGTVSVDMWRLVHQWSFFSVLTVFWLFLVQCWYTVGTVLVDIWRLVHQWSFFVRFWLCFDCFWRLVHCWYSLGRHVTIGTPMVIFAVLTVFRLFLTVLDYFWRLVHRWYTVGTVLVDLWRLVHQWFWSVFWRLVQCTICQKQSKDRRNSKITIGVPIVTCLQRVRRIHKTAKPPSHVPGQWPQAVARGQGWLYVSTWTSMRLAPVRCRVLLHSLLPTDDACSSSSLSTTVIKFSYYFRTPLANFLLSRPNSVEYGNSKTTTLLPSAKCTRPLFQGRTGCDGLPSGWHDIVTCQRLVINLIK